jgi:cardiolipin synthase
MTSIDLEDTQRTGRALASAAAYELPVAGHEVRVFVESPGLFEAMVRDIEAASERVWLESYTFAADHAGSAIAEAFKDRARAGLDVRVMFDGIGSLSTPNSFFDDLRAAGVQVHEYHSLGYALRRYKIFRALNRRNHRKLLVVDQKVAYFGGMNIIDQSGIHTVEQAKAAHVPASLGWRDVHARIAGPQVDEIAAAMERLWRRVHRQRSKWPRWPLKEMLAASEEGLFFFDCLPLLKRRRAHRVLARLIRQARHDLTVNMAYFIPFGGVLRELLRARRRGVKIRVIVPGNSDVWIVQWASRHFYSRLVRRGIRIYERNDLMLHSKMMVIDDQWTVIGSCNLDPRSLQWNLEFLGVLRSAPLASAMKRLCAYELRNSRRVTLAHCNDRAWWQRWLARIAWSCRRWL